MSRPQQTNNGNNAIQNIGDNARNTINNYYTIEQSKPQLPPTLMEKLLQQYINTIGDYDDEFELKLPSKLNLKLEFNHAKQYIDLFQSYAFYWDQLNSVERDFPNSQLIFNDLHRMFIEKLILSNSNGIKEINGDQLLSEMREKIHDRILKSQGFDAIAVCDEQLQAFCICLLALAVEKCKVLLNPDDQ
jgi:hypothetical protein